MGPTTLECCDDTGDSANDFVFGTPAPKNDAGTRGTLPASTCGNSTVEGLETCDDGNTAGGDGCSAVCRFEPDAAVAAGSTSTSRPRPSPNNGVLEPGETVTVAPSWRTTVASALALAGTAALFTGPAGATYTIGDAAADYRSIAPSERRPRTPDRLLLGVRLRARDASGAALGRDPERGPLDHGVSRLDAPRRRELPGRADHANLLPFIENLFHNGVTGGCAGGNYCPTNR